MDQQDTLRNEILSKVLAWAANSTEPHQEFIPGQTPIPVSGKVLSPADYRSLVDASLDGWLTEGRHTDRFQRDLARFVGVRSATMVNSGSSANLLALSALTSRKLGARALKPGDEVITPAMGFPTTVNPILQNRLKPVLVDVNIGTYDASIEQIQEAVGPRTKAIMMAHTLGNPFDTAAVAAICEENDLWLIEDSCDALGSRSHGRMAGSFGDTATLSFYPAHHITTGEGGAVLTNSPLIRRQVESFRDWGRDCYCRTGEDNTCHKRFEWQLGDLPQGYDHKYIYSHVGYNLKATDIQAALGITQLEKINVFTQARQENFDRLYATLVGIKDLILPVATESSEPSWFGFPITIHPDSKVNRTDLIRFLDSKNIASRLMFAGNIKRQPAYQHMEFRQVSDLTNSDLIMNRGFWLGVYPGLTSPMIDFVGETIAHYFRGA